MKSIRNECKIGVSPLIKKRLPCGHVINDEETALSADVAVILLAEWKAGPITVTVIVGGCVNDRSHDLQNDLTLRERGA